MHTEGSALIFRRRAARSIPYAGRVRELPPGVKWKVVRLIAESIESAARDASVLVRDSSGGGLPGTAS